MKLHSAPFVEFREFVAIIRNFALPCDLLDEGAVLLQAFAYDDLSLGDAPIPEPDERDLTEDIARVGRIPEVGAMLDVVARLTGMGCVVITRIVGNRWIACAILDRIGLGLQSGQELNLDDTICKEVRLHRRLRWVKHFEADPAYRTHPVATVFGLQTCISAPVILADGSFFGTLCAVDRQPARADTDGITEMFEFFAKLVASQLDSSRSLDQSQEDLRAERLNAEVREEFVAVLGHDLRNPLNAITGALTALKGQNLDPKGERLIHVMERSVSRMSGLIEDVLDFARGRLGGGFSLDELEKVNLGPVLAQIVEETNAQSAPGRILARVDVSQPVRCDRRRISQLLANLLSNAVAYGDSGQPVRVGASTEGGVFELSVANAGEPIPPEAQARLFLPFTRGRTRPDGKGLGLGLYIAFEIARAHGGTLDVDSTEAETRFTFRMRLR